MKKERYRSLQYFIIFVSLFLFILPDIYSYAGRICGSTSPCSCGSNCSGGNELYSQIQSYCDNNPIECFNTIDNCRDGTVTSLNYVKDIDIASLNDTVFRVGDLLEIDATLYSSSVNSEGVFFVYANGTASENVNWSVIYSTTFGAASSNYHIKYNYTIPNVIGDHTIRIIDIYNQVTNITCGRHQDADYPTYSDTDDLTFTVLAQPAPTINFTGPTPSNGTIQTTVTITINVTHNEPHPDSLILFWNGTNQSQSYSGSHTAITKSNLLKGNYSYYIWVNDTYGNVNQTETRTISINTPIDITLESPVVDSTYINNSVSLNLTVKPSPGQKNITWVTYQLNSDNNVTLTNYLNISPDTSESSLINESLFGHPNLSQSFTPVTIMEINNISIRLNKTGNPNVTLQLRTDASNNPSNIILANISIDNNTLNGIEYTWINVSLNGTITLQNNTKYWIFLSPNGSDEDHYDWEANDNGIYSEGASLQDSSKDLLFRVFDLYKYRKLINGIEDLNNITIYANNTAGIIISSTKINFKIDTSPPTYSVINESEDPIQAGNSITITINVTDVTSNVNNVIFEFNSSNFTMSNAQGTQYSITYDATIIGSNSYKFYLNDSQSNINSTGNFSYSVTDNIPPTFSNIANDPSTSNNIDPFVLINVTVNINDPGIVDSAILQYKNMTGDWINTSMSNSSSLYFGNFTPNNDGNWSYRIWANDSAGNTNISAVTSINASLDYSWTRLPGTFSAISGIKGSNVRIGNITINNTGDHVFSFELTSNQVFTSFNLTTPFTVNPGNYTNVEVNATTPTDEAEYSITITIDAENSTALPDSLTTTGTLASITSGPYLYIQIIEYNNTLSIGDDTNLVAKITNIGNETATNVVSNWTIPDGWTKYDEYLNKTLGNLAPNKFEYHNLSAYISSSSSSGSQTIIIYAQSSGGTNNTASETVTVSSDSTPASPTPTPGGGSSTSSSSGGGGGGFLIKKLDYDILIEGPDKIDLFTEQKKTYDFYVTNNIPNTVLNNILIKPSGFLLTKIDINPKEIGSLAYNEKKKISLTIDVPKYMKYQTHILTLSFEGEGKKAGNYSKSTDTFEKKYEIELQILEMTEDLALESIEKAKVAIDDLKNNNYNTVELQKIYNQAIVAFNKGDYSNAYQLSEEVISLSKIAYYITDIIQKFRLRIKDSKEKGVDLAEAEEFLDLAVLQLNKGYFKKAEALLNQAIVAERLSTKTSEAFIPKQIYYFIVENWLWLLIILLILGLLLMVFARELSIKSLSRKIKNLEQQEKVLNNLIIKIQTQYFKEKIMSQRIYHKSVGSITIQMTDIQKKKIALFSKKIGIIKRSKKKYIIEAEIKEVDRLILDIQSKYFIKKIISKDTYQNGIIIFKNRKAELEKTVELLDKKKSFDRPKPRHKKFDIKHKKIKNTIKPLVVEKKESSKRKNMDKKKSDYYKLNLLDKKKSIDKPKLKPKKYDSKPIKNKKIIRPLVKELRKSLKSKNKAKIKSDYYKLQLLYKSLSKDDKKYVLKKLKPLRKKLNIK